MKSELLDSLNRPEPLLWTDIDGSAYLVTIDGTDTVSVRHWEPRARRIGYSSGSRRVSEWDRELWRSIGTSALEAFFVSLSRFARGVAATTTKVTTK